MLFTEFKSYTKKNIRINQNINWRDFSIFRKTKKKFIGRTKQKEKGKF